MKKKLAILAFPWIGLVACEKTSTPIENDIKIEQSFSTKTSDFAFNFWKTFQKSESVNANYFISPLSLHMALGMLLNGTEGETKHEIQKVLGFENESVETINATYLELLEKLPNVDPKVINTIANSVWQSQAFSAEKDFLSLLSTQFKARLYTEDFTATATVDKINKWASDNTNAKIKKIVDEISPNDVMFLVNALYFKGDWTNQFDTKVTRKAEFMGTNSKKMVDMMYKNEKLKYANLLDYQLVELPYGNEKYAMQIILPNQSSTVESLVANLTNDKWVSDLAKMNTTKIIVELPKFTIQYSKKLNGILETMGMKKAFMPGVANLSKIAKPAGKLNVGFVKQDTFVAVDEKGTEAAAVTSIGIELTSLPNYPEVICNKPFAFVILEKTSNTILYIGKVSNL